ncbi:alpha/beta hydrolase [uncultured Sphingomonas sp.]|uniref:alpha/beta hydrolase n=1 Tax=uncultured Sphingomonas sp. TaxID=158754 RepID=UPI0035CC554A
MDANGRRRGWVDRRRMLAMIGVAGVAGVTPSLIGAARPTSPEPLWATPPGGGGPSGPVAIDLQGAVSNIAMPTIEAVLPDRPNGAAMLIAGGGGYRRIGEEAEARPAARWLAARGITAFILRYRLPDEGWHDGPLAPLQDAGRAMRMIRARAGLLGIDPSRVGVLGFSAGGHLLGLAAARSAFASYPTTDAIDRQSSRPDLSALIYPVITLEPPYDHTSTRRILIGDHPTPAASAQWSVETHVRAGCPPTFLVQAQDDPISDPHNTLIMRDACVRAGVPVKLRSLASAAMASAWGRPGRRRRSGRPGSSAGCATTASLPRRDSGVNAGGEDRERLPRRN